MGRPSPTRTKAFASPPVGGQTANLQRTVGFPSLIQLSQHNFGEEPVENGKAPDVSTQMTHALLFGHNFSQTANMAPVQRQSEEEEELDRKPERSLQRQTVTGEDDEEIHPKINVAELQRRQDEEDKLQRRQEDDDDEIHPKINVAALQRRQNEEDELQRRQEDDEELRPKLIQTKLTIGQPGDKYEQEADRMAAKVMAMPETQGLAQVEANGGREQNGAPLQRQINVASLLQRETLEEKKDDELAMKPLIQLKGEPLAAPKNFESQLAQHKGSGQPLSDEARAFMEPRFGADFSGVRVHETPDLANSIQAQAFTHGQDIYFNSGKYNPGSSGGKGLLAHELTHVVQQRSKQVHPKLQPQHGDNTHLVNVQRKPNKHEKRTSTQRETKEKKKINTIPTGRYSIDLLPPLRDPTADLGRPPLNLNLPQSYQMTPANGVNLPDWFWKELPPKPARDSLIQNLSRWLTQKLGRRKLAHIGGHLASQFNVDKGKATKWLNDVMVDGGEYGLKELLRFMLEVLAGEPNKRQGPDPTSPKYPGFQSPSPELSKPFMINLPVIKW